MATTKSSTKEAKTKTASAKTAEPKTTSAAKTPKDTISKKSKQLTIAHMRSLHVMSFGVFLLLAVLAGMLMNHGTSQLTLSYLAKDILHTDTLAPAIRVFYDLETRWLVVAVMLLSAVFPVLYITRWQKKYEAIVTKGRTMPWRWLDFAITGALMIVTIALLSGLQDIMMLKLIGGLIAGSFWLSWLAERQNNGTVKPNWSVYLPAVASMVLPWAIIIGSAIATVIFGGEWAPMYLYALYIAGILGVASIFCIQFTDYKGKKEAWRQNYLVVERNYLAVNLITKTAFALILILGLLK